MWLSLSCMTATLTVDPPSGGLSPLAWTIIVALATVLSASVSALWKMNRQMYRDLKECNSKCSKQDEDILGLLKVVRISMEQSKGGKPR